MPRGPIGRIVARMMEKANRSRNEFAISLLDLQPGDYVLEVGYACGMDMIRVANKVTSGLVVGVDHSESMFHLAHKRNKRLLDTGRMQLHIAPGSKLPFAYPYFDKVFSIDVAQYSKNPVKDFEELRRVLRPGGKAVVAIEGHGEHTGERLKADFEKAGFQNVKLERSSELVCVVGIR
jgi:ubiquinone/menaquinone biosynthesis C-methylase UbiE